MYFVDILQKYHICKRSNDPKFSILLSVLYNRHEFQILLRIYGETQIVYSVHEPVRWVKIQQQ